MGEGRPQAAKTYLYLITIYTTIALAICSGLLVVFKDTVALLFTNSPVLLPIVADNYRYVAVFLVIHGVGMSLGGALRGFGKQGIATRLVFFAFFIIGHPMSAIICFYFGVGLPGITLGFTLGSISMGILFYITITFFCDWENIARDVRKKMRDGGHAQKEGVANGDLKVGLLE
jgi:MATE family multidrug resistance protein